MAMTSTPQSKPEPTLQDVLDQLTILGTELDEVKRNQDEMQHNLNEVKRNQDEMQHSLNEVKRGQEQGQQWQDRTWDVVKWVGGISAGLAISASIALVGIVLRQLVQ
jgi:FtsZ-binding cell division protein ZapB